MKPSQLYNELVSRIQEAQRGVYLAPLFISGPPGIGKSKIAQQAAKDTGVKFYDNRLTLYDPTDVRGYPVPDHETKTVEWWLPKTLPTVGPALVAFEELNSAPPLVQAATYQLFLDRKLGDYTVPDGVVLIALGNRAEDKAVTFRLSSALASRFIRIELEYNVDDWFIWAAKNRIEPTVVSFIKARPQFLFTFDPNASHLVSANPRSWEFVSQILQAKRPNEVERQLVNGTVGNASVEFYAWLKMWDKLPDMERILNGEDIIPEKNDELYALIVSLVYKAKPEQYARLFEYAMAFPDDRVEFGALLGQVMMTVNNDAFTKGLQKNNKAWATKFLKQMGASR